MYRILKGFLFCLLVSLSGFTQTTKGSFNVTGRVKVDQGVVDGTHIQLFRNGTRIQDLEINRTGTFRVLIELNQNYRFYFANNNYYPKSIDFDTHIPPGVCNVDCNFPPYEIAILLYKKVTGVNEMPSTPSKISYNQQLDVFDPEILRQGTDLKKNISDALADAKQKAVLYDQKKIMDKKLNFERLIKEADTYFKSGKLEQSMTTYRDAAIILPNEKYPRERVDQAYYLLVSAQLQKSFGNPSEDNFLKYLNYGDLKFSEKEFTVATIAYESALAIRPEEQSIKTKYQNSQEEVKKIKDLTWEEIDHKKQVYAARGIKYKELIALGDEKLLQDDFLGAKDFYAQAASQIDENSYALLMLQKIDEITSSDELAIRLSRERAEADQKLLADARNKAYFDAIAEADRMFGERLYRDAIDNYELAMSIKDYELYPKQQIKTINDILAKLQLNGEEYNRLIREGDQLFQQTNYLSSKESYQNAHQLIPDEKYALGKIAEINRLLIKQDEENTKQKQYDKILAEGDSLFTQKRYSDAIDPYQRASAIKPTEKYPKEQILKIRGILSRESGDQRLLLQKQTEYDRIISQADETFSRQSYPSARSLYLKALQIFPGQEYPSIQIKRIDDLLNQLAKNVKKSKLDEIDFSNLQNLSKEDREAAFKEAMELGESFMKSSDWGVARFYFRRAVSLIPTNALANQRMNEADKMIRGNDVNESKFNEFVKRADESFKTGDISVAKFYYAKALEIKAEDNYAKERFNITDQLLQSTITSAGDREFDDALSKGDEAFSAKNYTLARFFYKKAISLKPNSLKAAEKLKQSESSIVQVKTDNGNSEYDRNIQLANQSFQKQNYGVAKNYYRQALTNKPNDPYCLNQLAIIDALMKK